jgi:hypothetical protein
LNLLPAPVGDFDPGAGLYQTDFELQIAGRPWQSATFDPEGAHYSMLVANPSISSAA